LTRQSTPDFGGCLFIYNRSGGLYNPLAPCVSKGGLSTRIYDLAGGVWRFEVELGSQPGRYSVEIADAARWPVMWGTTEPPAFQNGAYRLMVHTETLEGVLETPTHVRFWVSGVGFVGTAPFASSAFVNWMPTGSLAEGTYGYRAQLVSGPIPVADATAAEWFELNSRKR
jgi:hypothetical protein